MMRRRWVTLAVTTLLLTACGSADDGSGVRDGNGGSISGSGSGVAAACEQKDTSSADTTVDVTLDEWVVNPQPATVAAGDIAFDATNTGDETHELVIVEAQGSSGLPTDQDGAVDESQLPDGAVIGEIEGVPSGGACSDVFTLEPGDYVLLCNIVGTASDGTVESHYAEGMAAAFTVTE
jgi:hypothetical protein